MSHFGKSTLLGLFICLGFFVFATSTEGCDKSNCRGPVRIYEELRCQPTYEREGDCCAISYDCTHLRHRSADKCYANGRQYNLGETLRDEDRSSPCDVDCVCSNRLSSIAMFECAFVGECPYSTASEDCFLEKNPESCCPHPVCPKFDEEPFTCVFNGTTYIDEQVFYPNSNQVCQCSRGYNGEIIEPFCKNLTKFSCGIELIHSRNIRNNCTPVFYATESPSTSCPISFICPNDGAVILPTSASQNRFSAVNVPDNMKCKVNNVTMMIGTELKINNDFGSLTKCACEVPPMPSCHQLSSILN